MRKIDGLTLRSVGGENVVVAQDADNINFSRIISMNDSAAWLWMEIDIDFDAETLAKLLTQKYEVDFERALADSKRLIAKWSDAGIITE